MLFSQEKKFVFIAVPKTGTTSLEQELRRLDPDILRNKIVFPDGIIRKVNKHITLREVKKILGNNANQYLYFAFVREPIDHTISRYYFFKNGRARKRYESGSVRKERRAILGAKVWFARIVPRPCWFLLYPLGLQTKFISNLDDRIELDFCGRFDRLNEDFSEMLRRAGYDDIKHNMPHLNNARRKDIGGLEIKFISEVLKRRLNIDLQFYQDLTKGRSLDD